MDKQVAFSFRVFKYSQVEPENSSVAWSKYVKEQYLDHGWKVMKTEIAKVEGNDVFLGVTFVLNEKEPELAPVVTRRGRPRKVGTLEVVDATG